jgi:CBS domain-containing protein
MTSVLFLIIVLPLLSSSCLQILYTETAFYVNFATLLSKLTLKEIPMPIGEFCNREVVYATRETSIPEAAQLMRQYHVGDLVVVDEVEGKRIPVGMVTDRDIVIEIISQSLDLNEFSVGDIMSPQLISVQEKEGVFEAIRLMRAKGIRRIPVVNHEGGLEGVVTADDILDLLAEEMAELAKVAPREQEREAKTKI